MRCIKSHYQIFKLNYWSGVGCGETVEYVSANGGARISLVGSLNIFCVQLTTQLACAGQNNKIYSLTIAGLEYYNRTLQLASMVSHVYYIVSFYLVKKQGIVNLFLALTSAKMNELQCQSPEMKLS